MTMPRTCTNVACGRQFTPRPGGSKQRGSHGLCPTCYRRWADHGYPAGGVPRPGKPGPWPGGAAAVAARLEDLQFLMRDTPDITNGQLAARLGVTRRTVHRYRAALRAVQEQGEH